MPVMNLWGHTAAQHQKEESEAGQRHEENQEGQEDCGGCREPGCWREKLDGPIKISKVGGRNRRRQGGGRGRRSYERSRRRQGRAGRQG